jgi:hypothetical protein
MPSYFLNRFLPMPTIPASPLPSNRSVEGMGTGDTEMSSRAKKPGRFTYENPNCVVVELASWRYVYLVNGEAEEGEVNSRKERGLLGRYIFGLQEAE